MNTNRTANNPLPDGSNPPSYKFLLENKAYDKVAEGVIYRERADDDVNILVLTLENSSEADFTLKSGAMPVSNLNVPPSPSTLFLTFGNKDLSDTLSLQSLIVEVSTDGVNWTPILETKSGWRFKQFKANRPALPPYVGLCPAQDFSLASKSKARVHFRFTKLRCTYQGTSPQSLQIGCYNLPGDNGDKHLPLQVIDPPNYLRTFSDVFTPSLTSRTLPRGWTSANAEVLITPEAVFQAADHHRLVNEIKLTLSATGIESAGVDLDGSSFMLMFVAGTKYDTGALTTAGHLGNIQTQAPDGWKIEKLPQTDSTPAVWLIKPPDKMRLTKQNPVDIIFTNIQVEQGFLPGVTYVSLINRKVTGFGDSRFALPVRRAMAEAEIKDVQLSQDDPSGPRLVGARSGADVIVNFNAKVYLSWKAFAVPYLQLEYQTVDATGTKISQYVEYNTRDKDQTLSSQGWPISPIKTDTGFTLRAYNSPPKNSRVPDEPLTSGAPINGVQVKHTSPVIDFFWVTCTPMEAVLQWKLTFGELDSWLRMEVLLDQNGVPVYVPMNAEEMKAGQHSLSGIFDEKTTFTLVAWNSQCEAEKSDKKSNLGNGLDLIKCFKAEAKSPRTLDPTTTTMDCQLEVQFSRRVTCVVEQDPGKIVFQVPEDERRPREKNTFSVKNVPSGTQLRVKAMLGDLELIKYPATNSEITVAAYAARRGGTQESVRRFHLQGYENTDKYSHDFGEGFWIQNGSAIYDITMGAAAGCTDADGHEDRGIVGVRYVSKGPCRLDPDGHYYFVFDGTNQQIIPASGDMLGNLYEYSCRGGQYVVDPLPEFRWRITLEGVQGGPNWIDGGIKIGFPGGWWRSRPTDGRKEWELRWAPETAS